MKLRKTLSIVLAVMMMLALVAGCGGKDDTNNNDTPDTGAAEGAVKTGVSIVASVASSKDAELAQTDVTVVAVTVDDNGVIDDCVIDVIQAKVNFDATGTITTDLAATFPGKNELGSAYGMVKASKIGKEWNEQAQAFADYVVGKTVAEVKGIKVEGGKVTDADIASSVTISVGDFVTGIEAAVNNATHLGAQKGDELKVESITTIAKSTNATADAEGLAQAYATIAALTAKDETITSCIIDAVQADVKFDATGKITSDLNAAIKTKNELGSAYGMAKASSIGKEWNEQAAAFAKYVTGKTFAQAAGIAVEGGKATDADLASSVTISVGDFLALVSKSAK